MPPGTPGLQMSTATHRRPMTSVMIWPTISQDRPDGGDPGTGSAGADADLDDAAAGGPAEPEIAGGEPDDGADNDALAEADAGQDATTPAGNEVEEGVSDTPLLVADPESSVLPLVAGITAFLGGGALFLAARRVNRSDADLD